MGWFVPLSKLVKGLYRFLGEVESWKETETLIQRVLTSAHFTLRSRRRPTWNSSMLSKATSPCAVLCRLGDGVTGSTLATNLYRLTKRI